MTVAPSPQLGRIRVAEDADDADAVQRQRLQRRVGRVCTVMTFMVSAIDFAAWYSTGDVWKLSLAICMALVCLLFGLSLVLQGRGRHTTSLWSLLAVMPLVIGWIMVTGGAATVMPTLIAAMAMMLLLPDTLQPGIVSSRRWVALLLTAYTAGIGLRVWLRGLDFARSPGELAILALVPGTLIFLQWLLTQRMFRTLRAALGESEALRRAHEQRNAELMASQQALEQASGAKSQFLANMSHELRTPLNIIIGYTDILEEDLSAGDVQTWRPDLAKVRAASVHLLALISDVLDLSKVEAGKTDLFIEPFSLAALIHEVTDACRPLIRRTSNRLYLELDPAADELHTDRIKVRQILLNLLSNAAKFTNDGDITVRTTVAADDHIVLEVEDTGLGVPESARERIFDAFEQADTSSTRSHGGTGLGLTLVRRFARLLGGEVELGGAAGDGSRFRVTIPRRAAESAH